MKSFSGRHSSIEFHVQNKPASKQTKKKKTFSKRKHVREKVQLSLVSSEEITFMRGKGCKFYEWEVRGSISSSTSKSKLIRCIHNHLQTIWGWLYVTDNKTLWKTVKSFLSDKITCKEKITLIEENEIVSNDERTVQVLNAFFSNIVGILNIPEYVINDLISDNVSDPIIKQIVKYRKHLSILTIGEVCNEIKKETYCFFIFKSS